LQATQIPDFDASAPVDLAEDTPSGWRKPFSRVSLFWRTFFLLAILLIGSILAWLQTLRSLEFEPRAVQTAQLLASQVNLSRAALVYADGIARISLIKTMKDEEGLRIVPREPTDSFESKDNDAFSRRVVQELGTRLGKSTVVASSMNGQPGLWVSFVINGDDYWLQTDQTKFNPAGGTTWLIWLIVATVMSLAGAALIAGLINRPLKDLSFAASRMREGNFSASQLDEHVNTSEIREVNIGFNRMAQKLAKVEQDRALMLAGISHDLRTPLARLRLETEMSVNNEEARAHMAADIGQLDAIIDKFLDYARPDRASLTPVVLGDVVQSCIYSMRKLPDVQIMVDMDDDLMVYADEVELGRVMTNLLENARRYGKSVHSGIADIRVSAMAKDKWVLVKVRDHGIGVAPEQLYQLTQPFFRGEAARTAANGAGLGLAIVEKTMQRMGGTFHIANSSTGGLSANLRLQRATRF
jgi:two-component system osmolarity sensor histidine kinase EnvZ